MISSGRLSVYELHFSVYLRTLGFRLILKRNVLVLKQVLFLFSFSQCFPLPSRFVGTTFKPQSYGTEVSVTVAFYDFDQ